MNLRKFNDQLELKIISILLILSIFLGFMENIVDLPDGWEITLIFIAILMITRMLSTLYDIDSNIEKIMEKEGLGLMHYHSYQEFFKALDDEISQPHSSMALTHIRKDPPSGLRSGKNYFSKMEKMIEKNPDCIVRRMISIDSPEMLEWAKELLKLTEKHNINFKVNVCDWDLEFPMINMSIIDKSKVFLAITANFVENTPGIQIKDPKIVKYFVDYYDNMWANSSEISCELLNKQQDQSEKS